MTKVLLDVRLSGFLVMTESALGSKDCGERVVRFIVMY